MTWYHILPERRCWVNRVKPIHLSIYLSIYLKKKAIAVCVYLYMNNYSFTGKYIPWISCFFYIKYCRVYFYFSGWEIYYWSDVTVDFDPWLKCSKCLAPLKSCDITKQSVCGIYNDNLTRFEFLSNCTPHTHTHTHTHTYIYIYIYI